MAINTSRLFTALGRHIAALNETNTARGATLSARVGVLRAQLQGVAGGLDDSLNSAAQAAVAAHESWVSFLRTSAARVLLQEYINDRPAAARDSASVWSELVRQMVGATQSIDTFPCTVAVTPINTVVTAYNWGVSLLDEVSGAASNFAVPDTILAETLPGTGGVRLTGRAATELAAPTWPDGAGIVTVVQPTDPHRGGVGTGRVVNGNFASWSGGTLSAPWVSSGGVYTQATSPSGVGHAVQVAAGQPTVALRQTFFGTGGVFGFHLQSRFASAPADATALTLTARFLDNGGATLLDVDLTPASPDDDWDNGVFTGFAVVPATAASVELRITNGSAAVEPAQVAAFQIVEAPTLYPGGLRLVPWMDSLGITGAGTTSSIVTTATHAATGRLHAGLYRLFPELPSLPVRLPTSGSPTYSGSLIV